MIDQDRLGRYEDFKTIRLGMDDILASIRQKAERPVEPPVHLLSLGPLELVRYRLGSKAIDKAYADMGDTVRSAVDHVGPEYQDITAIFGVIDTRTGRQTAVITTMTDRHDKDFGIVDASFAKDVALSADEWLSVLEALGQPPRHNSGIDANLANHCDCWWSEGAWEVREPLHMVAVEMGRNCFDTFPAIKERTFFLFPNDPEHPFDGSGDKDAAYWAKDHYRDLAFAAMTERPSAKDDIGFSTWWPESITLVKIASDRLYRLHAPNDEVQSPTMGR